MRIRALTAPTLALLAAGCYTPPEPVAQARLGSYEPSEVVFQAVDAGTGGALTDPEMTVRYLVRAPVTYDETAVERVPSIEPYHISAEVAEPELVLEVRVEAPSYHRVDTAFVVPRGESVGPLTMRLSRRLDLVADDEPEPEPTPPRPTPTPAGVDRTALNAGNRAFERGDWLAAAEAYQRMPEPSDFSDRYGSDYAVGKTRQGIAHMNRAEFARALEVLEEATDLPGATPETFLGLAEAQCAVGRTEEGLGTLATLSRARSRMTPVEQHFVTAMIEYERGVCAHGEFERAETTRERVRSGAAAMEQFQAFIDGAGQMSPRPPRVEEAMEDAQRRIDLIRRTVGGRGA